MSKTVNQLLSKNAYAKYLGVNEKAVRKAINEGKIIKGWDTVNQKVIVKEADKEYGSLHKNDRPKPGVSKAKRAAKIDAQKGPEKGVNVRTKNVKSEVLISPNKSEVKRKEKASSLEEIEAALKGLSDGDSVEDLLYSISIHAGLTFTESTRRREIISLALDKKKLEELEGLLVRKHDVEKILFAFGNQLKKNLLAIPDRCLDDLLSANNKIEATNILKEEITNTLAQFANFNKINIDTKN